MSLRAQDALLSRLVEATRAVCRAIEEEQIEQLSPLLATRQEILDEMKKSGFSAEKADAAALTELREQDARMRDMAGRMREDLMEQMRGTTEQKRAMEGYSPFLKVQNP
jgi:hypothetical protein